ncbi:hypothetical protein N0V90_009367 [Kalmusia sp. IMI 367209]|nr:hypothetical protein N0V90_009367 [Kalmusia sp. IMI 367209]
MGQSSTSRREIIMKAEQKGNRSTHIANNGWSENDAEKIDLESNQEGNEAYLSSSNAFEQDEVAQMEIHERIVVYGQKRGTVLGKEPNTEDSLIHGPSMDVLSGIASVTQLAAYTHSAWKVFTRLYTELNGGPILWAEHKANIKHLLQVIERISVTTQQAPSDAAGQISILVRELAEIALKALNLVARAKTKGVLGVRWSAIGLTELLARTFESLKAKREILQLVLAQEQLVELSYLGNKASSSDRSPSPVRMNRKSAIERSSASANAANHDFKLVSEPVGHGSTSISNNGFGPKTEQVRGSIHLQSGSAGDRAAVNNNNYSMDTAIIDKQLEIAAIYARAHALESRVEQIRATREGANDKQGVQKK